MEGHVKETKPRVARLEIGALGAAFCRRNSMTLKRVFWIGAAAVAAAALIACGGGDGGGGASQHQQLTSFYAEVQHITVLVENDQSHPRGFSPAEVEMEIERLSIFNDVFILPEGSENEAVRREFNDARFEAFGVMTDPVLSQLHGADEHYRARIRLQDAHAALREVEGIANPGRINRNALRLAIDRTVALLGEVGDIAEWDPFDIRDGELAPDAARVPDSVTAAPFEFYPDGSDGTDHLWPDTIRLVPTGALAGVEDRLDRAIEVRDNMPVHVQQIVTQSVVDGQAQLIGGLVSTLEGLSMPGSTPFVAIGFAAGAMDHLTPINEGVITTNVDVSRYFRGIVPSAHNTMDIPLVAGHTRFIWFGMERPADAPADFVLDSDGIVDGASVLDLVSAWRFVDAQGRILDDQPTIYREGIELVDWDHDSEPGGTARSAGLDIMNEGDPAEAVGLRIGHARGTYQVRLFHGYIVRGTTNAGSGGIEEIFVPFQQTHYASNILTIDLGGFPAVAQPGIILGTARDAAGLSVGSVPDLLPNAAQGLVPGASGTWGGVERARTITFNNNGAPEAARIALEAIMPEDMPAGAIVEWSIQNSRVLGVAGQVMGTAGAILAAPVQAGALQIIGTGTATAPQFAARTPAAGSQLVSALEIERSSYMVLIIDHRTLAAHNAPEDLANGTIIVQAVVRRSASDSTELTPRATFNIQINPAPIPPAPAAGFTSVVPSVDGTAVTAPLDLDTVANRAVVITAVANATLAANGAYDPTTLVFTVSGGTGALAGLNGPIAGSGLTRTLNLPAGADGTADAAGNAVTLTITITHPGITPLTGATTTVQVYDSTN
jgi:hypothetical protein